ncbi:MAG: CpsD/CapB family tyrosine-protein kinase [Candidatus Zixiibacteriota bacterium]
MARRQQTTLIDSFKVDSSVATEFRRMLERIAEETTGRDYKAILVTSAILAEGKSTTCALMGIASARLQGLRTLIIDTDLRRPTMHSLLGVNRATGVGEILSDGYAAREAVKKTAIDKLDVITAGTVAGSAGDLFDAEAVATLIDEMKFYYDRILVDSAPALPVSDPMLLASRVDGTVLVVKAGSTEKDVITRAADILDPDRKRLVGVVINNMNQALPNFYDQDYYGYYAKVDKSAVVSKPSRARGRLKRSGGGIADRLIPRKKNMIRHD